jgi:catechol 2,3-dioxygenase-like lactoylglutathione lyase family enzyme
VLALHHVQLAMPAGAEDEARAFYGDVLGFREVAKPPALAPRGGVWFRADGVELHLGVEEPFQPARKAHPGILTDTLDELADRLAGAGCEVRPDELLPGYRRFYVDDCFGNRLEFLAPAR